MLTRHLFRLAAGTRWGVDDRRAGPGGSPLQVAALPYRFDTRGKMEVLLVTSRTSRRWIVPKGWPVKGYSLAESAAREAYEEAGVRGVAGEQQIGAFQLEKQSRLTAVRRPVIVFPLLVSETLARWPEASQRQRLWLPRREAAARVDIQALRPIIDGFEAGAGGSTACYDASWARHDG